MFEVLKTRQIRSAALDVWYYESWFRDSGKMLANLPFSELDNVLMSPHAAVATTGVLRPRLAFTAANVDRLANGELLLNVLHVG